jgi:glycine betaine-binding periplasmic protein
MTHLLKTQLEKAGYQIKLTDLSEAGPLYAGLSQGAVDLYPSAWPDITHKDYMDKYRKYIEDLGAYYDSAKLCWSVPDYSSMASIEDIKPHASQIDNRIVGIEPGSGLVKVSEEKVIPAYGLQDMKFLTSSTASMLTELKKAVDAKQEIVVTLWHPFWANTTFNMRDLEDPKGAFGKGEGLHFLGREGFAQEYPEVASWLGSIKMDEATYGSLEDLVVNTYGEGKEDEAAIAWSQKYPQYDFKKS